VRDPGRPRVIMDVLGEIAWPDLPSVAEHCRLQISDSDSEIN
jgi:hypothetical protein